MDFQLPRGLLFYFIKYQAAGTRLYNINKTKMVPEGTCSIPGCIFVVTAEEREGAVWRAEAR